MKNSKMQASLAQPLYSPLDRFFEVINELLEKLKDSKETFVDNFNYCRQIRTNRKHFEKDVKNILSKFASLSEKQQVEIELHFYRKIQKLEILVPEALEDLEKSGPLWMSYFLRREVRKAFNLYKSSQTKMSARLYPDNSPDVSYNPEQYQRLVDAWGDLADEY